jgi:nitric oxide synthase oxygenase domain/subunit
LSIQIQKDYRRKALCSIDDQGRCYGCEMHRRDMKAGWKGRSRLYINVLVDDGTEEPYVAIFSQGAGPKSATPEVIQYAGGAGSITNVIWRLKRTGEKTDTNYSIIPLPASNTDTIDPNLEIFDLEKMAVRDVPYAEQEAFYSGTNEAEESTSSAVEW